MSKIVKFIANAVTKGKVEDQYDFIGSTEDPDRDGDVIRLDGWDTTNFEKNPVVFYGHDYRGTNVQFPVGTAIVTKDAVNRRLMFSVTFTDAHEDAQTVKALVDDGVLRASSVGFMPKDGGVNLIVNPENGQVVGREFSSQELLELSIVPLPANPNAVRLALSKGLCTEEKAKAWGLIATKDDVTSDEIQSLKESVEAVHKKIVELDTFVKSELQKIEQKMMPLAEAGSEAPTVTKQEEEFYADLLTLSRKMTDYLHSSGLPDEARLAGEIAATLKG